MTAPRDPGLAYERTTLAWNRTGLSSVGVGAICLKVFWGDGVLGLLLATAFLGVGVVAYTSGANPPASRPRLLTVSLGVTAAAVLGVIVSIVG